MSDLRKRLQFEKRFSLFIGDAVDILCNDEGTRSFLTLPVVMGCTGLQRIIDCIDSVMKKYQLPQYYSSPLFHISFASTTGNVGLREKRNTNSKSVESVYSGIVDNIKCKLGKSKVFQIDLLA